MNSSIYFILNNVVLKIFASLVVFVFPFLIGLSGLCSQVRLTTQAEVDAWDQSISVLNEFVIISGDDITNIDALANLTAISGFLAITANPNLNDLDGLRNITEIISPGSLSINSNPKITHLEGLRNLSTVNNWIHISDNEKLSNCCAIKDLISDSTQDLFGISNNDVNCSSTWEIISRPCIFNLTHTTNLPCLGENNGSLDIFVNDYKTKPFHYKWNESTTQQSGTGISNIDFFKIDRLEAGIYNVTVTTPNGDTVIINDIILDPILGSTFEISEVTSINSTNGAPNGSVTIQLNGSAPPYSILWNGPTSGRVDDITGSEIILDKLLLGLYSIQIIDSNQNTIDINFTILNDELPFIGCTDPLDIVILNDVSSSVDVKEYNESKAFLLNILNNVNVAPGEFNSRASIVEWSEQTSQEIRIEFSDDLQQLNQYSNFARSFNGGTFHHPAMEFARDYLEANGRPGTQKVIILATDGAPPFSLVELARGLKDQGYYLITIAIDEAFSNTVSREILRRVASLDLLAPGAASYLLLDSSLAEEIVNRYLCPQESENTSIFKFQRDGAITIDSFYTNCVDQKFVELTFSLAASEQLSIPSGTIVSFYLNNPLFYNITPIYKFTIPCSIPSGTTEKFTITLPLSNASNIYALLNDDGSKSAPFHFPITKIEETLYSNNIDSVSVCLNNNPTLQAFKSLISPTQLCDSIALYSVIVCNIGTTDAVDVMVVDDPPLGSILNNISVDNNTCGSVLGNLYNIPSDCCTTLLLEYNMSGVVPGDYDDLDVYISGPDNQEYIDFNGVSSSAEDISIFDSNLDCEYPKIEIIKEVSSDIICEDAFLTYTFTIINETNTAIKGAQFIDVLPNPIAWVFEPYFLENINISSISFSGGYASFVVDDIPAQSTASFQMDVHVGDWSSGGNVLNQAILENVHDIETGGFQTIHSNTVSTTILTNVDIPLIDTLRVEHGESYVDVSAIGISGAYSSIWTSGGDGYFDDVNALSTQYYFGPEDIQDTIITLFISVESECEQIGRQVIVNLDCFLDLDYSLSTECQGSNFYLVKIETDNYQITNSNGLPIQSISSGNYLINNVPVLDTLLVTIEDTITGCQTIILANSPECTCTAFAPAIDNKVISCYENFVHFNPITASQGSNYAYTWYNDMDSIVSTDLSFTATEAGIFTFEVYDKVLDCKKEQSVIVTDIRNNPDANIVATDTVITCIVDTIQITIETQENVTYIWSLPNGINIDSDIINIANPGAVSLAVQDTLTGCSSENNIVISIDTLKPHINIEDPDILNCQNNEVIIDATTSSNGPRISSLWMDSLSVPLPILSTQFSTDIPGLFYLQLINNSNGCSHIDSIVVISNFNLPDITLEDEYNLSCAIETLSVTPTVISPESYSSQWILNENIISIDLPLIVVEPGLYFLEVTNNESKCAVLDSIKISPPNDIEAVIVERTNPICAGESTGVIEFSEIIGGMPSYTYLVNNSVFIDPRVEELKEGTYEIVITDAAGCSYDTIISLVDPEPITLNHNIEDLITSFGDNLLVSISTNIELTDIDTIIWNPSIDCENCLEYFFENLIEEQSYTVTVVDKNGCQASIEFRLDISNNYPIYLPNVMSSLIAEENYFYPQSANNDITIENLYIYDRWGNLVFLNSQFPINSKHDGWDGKIDGKDVEVGVYVYYMVINDGENIIIRKGDLTLLR